MSPTLTLTLTTHDKKRAKKRPLAERDGPNSSDSQMAATTMLQQQDILMSSAFPLDSADPSLAEDLPDAAAAGSGSGVPDFVKKLYRQVTKRTISFFSLSSFR